MDWLFTFKFYLTDSYEIVMAIVLVTFLFVNKVRFQSLLFFLLYFIALLYDTKLIYYLTPSLLFVLVIRDKNIKYSESKLERCLFLLLIVALLSMYNHVYLFMDFFILKHSQSLCLLYLSIILCRKKHRNYVYASILMTYNIMWTSYSILWSPFVKISLPLACLSLALFLLHYIMTDYKGSIVHCVYCKITKSNIKLNKSKFVSVILENLRINT